MNKLEFATEFGKLLYAKQVPVERVVIEVYWEDLSQLDFLGEALKECRNRTWFRDFDRTVPRFPESPEIKQVHAEIVKKKEAKNFHQLSEPKTVISKYLKEKPAGYARIASKFCKDCMIFLGLNCADVWEYCEDKNIDIPLDYQCRTNDTEEFEIIANNIIGDGIKDIKKIKNSGNIFTALKGVKV